MPHVEASNGLNRYRTGYVSDILTEASCSTKQRIPEIDSAPYDLFTETGQNGETLYTLVVRIPLDGQQVIALLSIISRDGQLTSRNPRPLINSVLADINPMLRVLVDRSQDRFGAENAHHHMGDIREVFLYFLHKHGQKFATVLETKLYLSDLDRVSFRVISREEHESPVLDLQPLNSDDVTEVRAFFDQPEALNELITCLTNMLENKSIHGPQAQLWLDHLASEGGLDAVFSAPDFSAIFAQKTDLLSFFGHIYMYFDIEMRWQQHRKQKIYGDLCAGFLKKVVGSDGKEYYVTNLLRHHPHLENLQLQLEAAVPQLPLSVLFENADFSIPYRYRLYQGHEYHPDLSQVTWDQKNIVHMVPVLRWMVDVIGNRTILGSQGTLDPEHPLQQLDSSIGRPDEDVSAHYDLLLGLLLLLYVSPEIHTNLPKMVTTQRADGTEGEQIRGPVRMLLEPLRAQLTEQLVSAPVLKTLEAS